MTPLTQDTTPVANFASTASQGAVALVSRLLLATLFILAGFNKIGAAEGMTGYIASVGLPFPEAIYFGTVALEIVGGLMLAVGFKARYTAAALGVFSIAAAVLFHNTFADQAEMTNFLKNCSLAGGMFMVSAFGPGRLSFDRG